MPIGVEVHVRTEFRPKNGPDAHWFRPCSRAIDLEIGGDRRGVVSSRDAEGNFS
jgi:hypothetical protein